MIMRESLLSLLFLLLVPVFASSQGVEDRRIHIMSYNIRHGNGMDERVDLERISRFISQESPDVVALQELDSCCRRTDFHNQLAELSQMTGMYPVFGPAMPFQGGKYGVGILSREKPLSVSNHPLPGGEPRTLIVAEFASFVLASTHLALEEEARLASVPVICQVARNYDKPFFVAGDWNDDPQSQLLCQMKQEFTFCSDISFNTFPSDRPTTCIDYIAVWKSTSTQVRTMEKSLHQLDFSDHCAIAAKVSLGGR